VLIVVAATDVERRIIPNRIVLPATAFVLLARVAFFPNPHSSSSLRPSARASRS
jgi:Flp pilus assembly protein protease CpaA